MNPNAEQLLSTLTQAGSDLGFLSGESSEDKEVQASLDRLKQALANQQQAVASNQQGESSNPQTVEMDSQQLEAHLNSLEAQLSSLQHTLADLDAPTQQLLASSLKVWAGGGSDGQNSGTEELSQEQSKAPSCPSKD